jgi:hypothetical protein
VLIDLIDTISTTPAPRLEGVPDPLVLPVPSVLTEAVDARQGSLNEPNTPPPLSGHHLSVRAVAAFLR